MTKNYQIEFSDKENGWVAKKQSQTYRYNRVPNSPSFGTIEEAEKWIEDNHKPAYKFDRPWIDHVIDGSSGHLIPLQEWKECCDDGGFIDYDGYGDAVDEHYHIIENGSHIKPSHYTQLGGVNIPIDTKYILWYNR